MKFFFYGNIYIGFLAAGLVWANSSLFNTVNYHLIGFIFFSSVLVYNIDRILFINNDLEINRERSLFIKDHYELFWFLIIICTIAIAGIVQHLNLFVLIFSLILFLLTILYFNIYNSPQIKSKWVTSGVVGFLKPALLAFVWSTLTCIIPVLENTSSWKAPLLYILFFIRFSEYSINGFLFDYRDKSGDRKKGKENIFNILPEQRIIISLLIFVFTVIIFTCFLIIATSQGFIFIPDIIILVFYFVILIDIGLCKKFFFNKSRSKKMIFSTILDLVLFLPVIFFLFKSLKVF